MTQDKAREFFSAYFEGTLEPGLRHTLEVQFERDPALRADYGAFAETYAALQGLGTEEIEIPGFLSTRIASRLEEERGRRQSRTPAWMTWLRRGAYVGLATAALAGAFLSFRGQGQVAGAGLVETSSDAVHPSFSGGGSLVTMSFRPQEPRTVVVSSGVTGREIERFTVNQMAPARPLENRLSGTALFRIEVMGDPASSTLLALPGSHTTNELTGSGSVQDLAVALAERYHVPVLVHSQNESERLSWNLSGADARDAASRALKGHELSVDSRGNGMLYIAEP